MVRMIQNTNFSNLLLPPAEGCEVQVSHQATNSDKAIEQQPREKQPSSPPPTTTAQYYQDVHHDGKNYQASHPGQSSAGYFSLEFE